MTQNNFQNQNYTSENIDVAKFRFDNFNYYVKIVYSVKFNNFSFIIYKKKTDAKVSEETINENDYEFIGKFPVERHQIVLLKNLLSKCFSIKTYLEHTFEILSEKIFNRLFIKINNGRCVIGGRYGRDNIIFEVEITKNAIDYFNFLSATEYAEKIAVNNVKPYTFSSKKQSFENEIKEEKNEQEINEEFVETDDDFQPIENENEFIFENEDKDQTPDKGSNSSGHPDDRFF